MFDALPNNISKINTTPEQRKPKKQEKDNNFNPQEVQMPNTESFNLVPVFPDMDDDPLESDNLLEIINKIEKENAHLVPNVQISPKKPVVPVNKTPELTKVMQHQNMNYNSVVQNVNRHVPFPSMFFPNSNVTINYNFNK